MQLIHAWWRSPKKLLVLSVAVVLMLQTALCLQSASIRSFASSDAGVKLWQVQGILHFGRLDAPINYPGAVYDPNHQYSPFVAPWFFWQDGLPYSEYTSPFIWASVPLFAWFGHPGLYVWPWLTGALLIVLSAWLAWHLQPARSAALVPIIVGLSTPLLLYSLDFWEHTAGTFLAVLALVSIIKSVSSSHRNRWLTLAGASIGLGLTMRAELYVFPVAVAIGLFFIRRNVPFIRSLFWLAVGGLLIAGPWWIYDFVRWGSPFGPRLQQNIPFLGGTEMLQRLSDTTGRNWTMIWPYGGDGITALAILGGVAILLAVSVYWLKRLRIAQPAVRIGFWILAVDLLAITAITTWRVANWQNVLAQRPDDLLTTFPLVLLLFLQLQPAAVEVAQSAIGDDKSHWVRFLLVVSVAFVALVLLVSPFQGGVQWGPRFLLPVVVPLSIVVVVNVERWWPMTSRLARIGLSAIFAILLLGGVLSTWNGMLFMYNGQINNATLTQMIESAPEHVVVADAWFLTQSAPYTFSDKIWLLAEDEKPMFQLIQSLRKTTNEPGMLYLSSLTWAHIDPQVLMGPRIAPNGDPQFIDSPGQYLQLSRYFLYK